VSVDISRFELGDQDHGDLFGVFLAVHAIPGAVMFLHTTVGCKFKTQRHLVDHDWFRESHNQCLWTGVDDVRLIRGTGKRLLEYAKTWYERRKPTLAVVVTNAAVGLSDFDVRSAVDELSKQLPCAVLLLESPGWGGGLHQGYRRMIEAVAGLADWERRSEESSVALVGYLFDRFEMDHVANLNEVKRLLAGIGLRTTTTFLGGEGLESLRRISDAATLLALPCAHASCESLEAMSGRRVIPVDLPVGIRGTSRFLRLAGKAANADPELLEGVVEKETAKVVPLLAHAAGALEGMRVAVFLDTPMAAAVTAFFSDLDIEIPLVCLTDGEIADAGAFFETLGRLVPPGAEKPSTVLEGPSRNEALAAFHAVAERDPIPVVVGSSIQRMALMHGQTRVVELGYPSAGSHALYPIPWMGYNGAVALAERMVRAANSSF